MVNTMGWNEHSDPDMRTANFCDVYREGVYTVSGLYYCCKDTENVVVIIIIIIFFFFTS